MRMDHRGQHHERHCPRPLMSRGSLMMRGKTRGALTIAIAVSRPNASLPDSSTTKLRLLFTTCGNGCAGSSPIGVSSGRTSCVEIVRGPGALRARELGAPDQPHACGLERGQDLLVQHAVLVRDDRARFLARAGDGVARLLQRHARWRDFRPELLPDAGHADLEELVEVAADDAEEAQPLEQRHAAVLGERQHAPIESRSDSSRLIGAAQRAWPR